MRNYKNIQAWQAANDLVITLYGITKKFPREELFGLTSQIRRAAVSVAANIVEGAIRSSTVDYLRFLRISIGSLNEVGYYIDLSLSLGFLTNDSYNALAEKHSKTICKLFRLIEVIEKQI